MKPERWQQIERLYHSALEREASQRGEFLDAACDEDGALRREVESLLRYEEQMENFLEAGALEVAAEMLADSQVQAMAGRTLGHYQIISLLGAGGMGAVYRATDTRLDRGVAIKVLPAHLTTDQEALRRFEREAKAVAALSHPNILAIHDFGTEQGVSYAVMELLEGETLDDCLARSTLSWRKAVEIGVGMAEGLAAAHVKGIIHRDLKPENIFLTTDGQVKILDFGIARLEPTGAEQSFPSTASRITQPGVVMGSIGYMSPEQVRGEVVKAASDIFSFGCVLYEMISGAQPFARASGAETLAAILKDDPAALAETDKRIPEEVERVVRCCLEKRAEERYESARDVAFDLRAILSGAGVSKSSPALTRHSLHPAVWIVVALVMLLLGVSAWLYLGSGREKVIDSLAILPLVNASGDANVEYLSDGITESLINNLSQLPRLRVMARPTVFRYKGREVDPRQIGQELKVRAVLTGRVVQRGESLSIQADLVDTADGTQVWGAQYNRQPSEILAVQEEIAKDISAKLRLKLTGEEQQLLTKRYTENTEAYQLYLKGRYFLSKATEEEYKRGLEYFKQAIDLDPNYALAYTGMADAYYWLSNNYLPPKEAMPKSRAAAMRALELDEMLAEAHASLAIVKSQYDWDWMGAERAYKRALELKPGYASAHHMYGLYLIGMGRPEESLAELRQAQELDPLSPSIAVYALWPYYFAPPSARQYDRAIEEVRKIIAVDPDFHPAHSLLGEVYAPKGMYEEAIAEQNKVRQSDNNTLFLGLLGYVYALAGKKGEAQQMLSELQQRSKREYVTALSFANVYASLGEKDQAFAWMQKAYENRDEFLVFLNVDSGVDRSNMRSDPRFTDLLRRMGFTP